MGLTILDDKLEDSGREQRLIKSALGNMKTTPIYKGPGPATLNPIKVRILAQNFSLEEPVLAELTAQR